MAKRILLFFFQFNIKEFFENLLLPNKLHFNHFFYLSLYFIHQKLFEVNISVLLVRHIQVQFQALLLHIIPWHYSLKIFLQFHKFADTSLNDPIGLPVNGHKVSYIVGILINLTLFDCDDRSSLLR